MKDDTVMKEYLERVEEIKFIKEAYEKKYSTQNYADSNLCHTFQDVVIEAMRNFKNKDIAQLIFGEPVCPRCGHEAFKIEENKYKCHRKDCVNIFFISQPERA